MIQLRYRTKDEILLRMQPRFMDVLLDRVENTTELHLRDRIRTVTCIMCGSEKNDGANHDRDLNKRAMFLC